MLPGSLQFLGASIITCVLFISFSAFASMYLPDKIAAVIIDFKPLVANFYSILLHAVANVESFLGRINKSKTNCALGYIDRIKRLLSHNPYVSFARHLQHTSIAEYHFGVAFSIRQSSTIETIGICCLIRHDRVTHPAYKMYTRA